MRIFRDYDQMGLDRQCIPTEWTNVPLQETIDRWSQMGTTFRSQAEVVRDLAYGDSERQCIDFYLPLGTNDAPVLVFIHGGYWRSKTLVKIPYCFCVEKIVEAGALVAMVEYDLCPDVSMDTLVQQIRHAVSWVWRNAGQYGGDTDRLVVSGHSAGGHLAAMMAATDWPKFEADLPSDLVRSIVSISGLFELEPLMLTINESLKLDPAAARRNSPRYMMPVYAMPISVVVGGGETDEFRRQSSDFAEAWRTFSPELDHFEISGQHHFAVIEAMTEAHNPLTAEILKHLGLA